MTDQTRIAKANKAKYQESFREHLRAKGLEQHVLEIANKLHNDEELASNRIQALKASAELRLKLLNKCVPDLKAIEVEGDIDATLTIVRKDYMLKDVIEGDE